VLYIRPAGAPAIETACQEAYVIDMKRAIGPGLLSSAARQLATLLLASNLLVASAGALAAPSNDQQTEAPTAAKWVPRKVRFTYSAISPSSKTTYYSCDSLQGQVTGILRQLGARDVVTKPFGCITTGPERFPGVEASFSVLEPAGSGDQGSASSKSVPVQWDKVTLTPNTSCALIEQVKRQILPLFATRNQTSSCSPRFSVEVLRPATPAAADAASRG